MRIRTSVLTWHWRRVFTPIALALVSLVAAFALWVVVTQAENPNRIGFFAGAIEVQPINVPDGLAVASIYEPAVSIRISAPSNTFDKLTGADFQAFVDLSGVRQNSSEQRVIARVASRGGDAQVVGVTPSIVTVTLEPLASKVVPVTANLVGGPAQGFSVERTRTSPDQVRVSGAESLVRLVSAAIADVNVTGLRVGVKQSYPLVLRDARGADIRGVAAEPSSADVDVSIVQREATLALTILPSVRGEVAEGYNLLSITSDPLVLPVSGPLDVLQSLQSLTTEEIDLSGFRSDTTRAVRLRLPSGLRVSRDTVNVRLRIAPAQGEVTLAASPRVLGIGSGITATLQTAAVSVTLKGEMPTLRSLDSSSIQVTVDVSGLQEGVQVLRPLVTVPSTVQLGAVNPTQVIVVLRR